MSKYKLIILSCVKIIKIVAKDINGVKGISDFIDFFLVKSIKIP